MELLAGICGGDGHRQALVVRGGQILWQGDDTGNHRWNTL